MTIIHETCEIPEDLAGQRLDQALAQLFPDYSRARLQVWIKAGQILVDGKQLKPKEKVETGQAIEINAEIKAEAAWQAQQRELNIVYEDADVLVVNKPVGIVVHPAAGNPDNTLINAVLHHAPECAKLPRCGIVHRLDKDTSGLLVIAKSLVAHTSLVRQIQQRTAEREYVAVVYGEMISGGTVDAAMDRHPVNRKKMAIVDGGKPAITHYRVSNKFHGFTELRVILETGRTHQIRVHMAHIKYPIVGDQVYGGRLRFPKNISEELREFLQRFKRQALHAAKLSFVHPVSGEQLSFTAKLPDDIQNLLTLLDNGENHA